MKYRTTIRLKTIIVQIDIFFKNIFRFELDERKLGSINIRTNNNAIVGTILSKFINGNFYYVLIVLTFPETFSFLKEFFNTWI